MGEEKKRAEIERVPGYTKKQSQFIRGEITEDEVSGVFAGYLLKKAKELGDEENIRRAEELAEKKHTASVQVNRDRARKRWHKVNSGKEIEWKQPKTSEYSEYQKAVIRGDIPIEDVHTNILVAIHLKAKNCGDIELSERLYDLIQDRRREERERISKRAENYFRDLKNRERPEDLDNEYEDLPEVYEGRDHLVQWEYDILMSRIEPGECSLDHLRHILNICQETGEDELAELAGMLIDFRENPDKYYVTQDHEQAIDDIERMMGKPLRRPDTWFK